jgi:hypothetical protein
MVVHRGQHRHPRAGHPQGNRAQHALELGRRRHPRSLVHLLESIKQGLLDELTLLISPVVAGGGRRRLFPDDSALTRFELVEGRPTSSGALMATYRPVR